MTRRPDETPTLPALRIAAAIAIALVAIVAVPTAVGLGLAEDKGDTALDEAKVEQQRVQIHKEIATIQRHPWAGEYYEGDGLGANIRMSLAPNAGVAATWHGCMGLYGANRGKVMMRDGELRFEYEQPNRQGFGGFPDALRPIRWGARRYMIPDGKRIAFVNAINHGREPRNVVHGMFLLAEGDEKKAAGGLPDLPPADLALIRRAPMQVRVVSIDHVEKKKSDTNCSFTYQMTLDRGTNDRLAPGIELKPVAQPRVWETATIQTAAARTSTATLAVWFDDCAHPKTVPAAGWILSTGAYDGSHASAR